MSSTQLARSDSDWKLVLIKINAIIYRVESILKPFLHKIEETKVQNISFNDVDTRKTNNLETNLWLKRLDFIVNEWTEWTNEKKQST